MQAEGQVQEIGSENNAVQSDSSPASSPIDDIANSYDGSDTGQEEQDSLEGREFGDAEKKRQKAQARWEKILNERKQDKELIRVLQEKAQQYDGEEFQKAAMVRDLLKSQPKAAQLLYQIFAAKQDPIQAVQELYQQKQAEAVAESASPLEEEYDERTAARFKELDELKRWKQDQESKEQAFMQEQIQNYQRDLDIEHERRLQEDGFLDENGSPVDETYVSLIDNVVRALLQSTAKNPNIPTAQEYNQAYSSMKQCIKYVEDKIRRDMSKKSVSSDLPPLSGTSSGQMPIGKGKISEDDRVMDLANSFFN